MERNHSHCIVKILASTKEGSVILFASLNTTGVNLLQSETRGLVVDESP